jgi:hypothetical protein
VHYCTDYRINYFKQYLVEKKTINDIWIYIIYNDYKMLIRKKTNDQFIFFNPLWSLSYVIFTWLPNNMHNPWNVNKFEWRHLLINNLGIKTIANTHFVAKIKVIIYIIHVTCVVFASTWFHPQFFVGSMLLINLVFCGVFVLFVYILCCVPNIASVSWLRIAPGF